MSPQSSATNRRNSGSAYSDNLGDVSVGHPGLTLYPPDLIFSQLGSGAANAQWSAIAKRPVIHVVLRSADSKVCRLNAYGSIAGVQHQEPLRNRSVKNPVGRVVRSDHAILKGEGAVLASHSGRPVPAFRRWWWITHEPAENLFFGLKASWPHLTYRDIGIEIPCTGTPVVMSPAPSSAIGRSRTRSNRAGAHTCNDTRLEWV